MEFKPWEIDTKKLLAEVKAREAERIARMTPDEIEEMERRAKEQEEYEKWLDEPVTRTRGEIFRDQDFEDMAHEQALETAHTEGFDEALAEVKPHLDQIRDERDAAQADAKKTHKSLQHALGAWGATEAKRAHTQKTQGGIDRKLTAALKRIAELEATVAQLTKERDAARRALLNIPEEEAR